MNVDITPGGKSVKKRSGYGLYKTLGTTQGLHGGFHFFDSTGNDVQVWGSSTSVYGIVADGTPSQIVSSATLNSTLDCADTQGSAYCVTSNRDFYIKTNGSTLQSWSTSPLGTMIEATPDRIVVAGVSAFPNTLYVSGSNAFTTFTVGLLTTDPFNEVIAAPGSKLTHIRWGCQRLLWWKDQSFGYFDFADQYSAQVKIVSDNIGTFDNTSAIDPGGNVWFRGQDGHVYKYDCSGLVRETIEITPQIQSSGRRTTNSWVQTSQSDFETGASSATGTLSTTISAGDVVASSFNVTENSNSQWSLGSTNNTTVGTSSITLSTNNSGNVLNNSFESGQMSTDPPTNWTNLSAGSVYVQMASSNSLTSCANAYSGFNGSFFVEPANGQLIANSPVLIGSVIDASTGLELYSSTYSLTAKNCTFASNTLSAPSAYLGRRIKLRFIATDTSGSSSNSTLQTNNSYILGGDITFLLAIPDNGSHTSFFPAIDNVLGGSSTITSGSFQSQSFNTGMPYSFVNASATWSINTSTPSFVLQKSANGSSWTDVTSSTGQNNAVNARYYRYLSTFTITSSDNSLSTLAGIQIIARSSGTYFSAWKNASSLASWSTFNPTYSNGDGSHAFYIRSSTSPQSVLNSTVAWVAQTADALVAASTGTYFQLIDSFTITSATGASPSLNAFTVNWYEGNAVDQAYLLYFDNAIWASVAYGVGISSNNYIFRRDLINDGWGLYYFGGGGLLIQNNHLFFGDVGSTGKIFQFGSGTSDNGSAINAYWKSKDFTGQDPFLQNQLNQIDLFAKQNTGQTLTATYALDTSTTTTSYSINVSTATQSIIQNRKLLPSGKTGYTFNYKFGDNTTSSDWEVFGLRMSYTTLPWKPSQ